MAFPKRGHASFLRRNLREELFIVPPRAQWSSENRIQGSKKPEAKPEVKPQVAKAPETKKPFKVWKILPIIIVPIIIFIIFINIGGGGPFSGEWMSPHPCTFRELLCGESRKQGIQGIFT
jgi:hypothetical protein